MHDGKFYRNVLLKGLLLFIVVALLFAFVNPMPVLGRVSLYNWLVPGRERLPYGEKPDLAYNLSTYNLEAMFASHILSAGPKPAGEYRVILLGDSSVWGVLLTPEQTLAGQLNHMQLKAADGRRMVFYNLGYPTLSLTKDLMLLQEALKYQPDQFIWLVTLQSFPLNNQLESPLLANNPQVAQGLINAYHLPLNPNDPVLAQSNFWSRTLIGQRRALADLLRLQLYGFEWAATGVDQYYPPKPEQASRDLKYDLSFNGWNGPQLPADQLGFNILAAGIQSAGKTPVLVINEPIMVSSGKNSDVRYNSYYPHWAYDQYRVMMEQHCQQQGWTCMDEWKLLSEAEFTNTAIHPTPQGEFHLAERVAAQLTGKQ
jgi:hypothetical protein